jgi:type VI secretion system protein VasG
MVTSDVKELLSTLNEVLTSALEGAVGTAVDRQHDEVTLEHLLVKLLEREQVDLRCILRHFDVRPRRLHDALTGHLERVPTGAAGRPEFSPLLLQVVEAALLVGRVHHDLREVRSGTLLEAMLQSDALRSKEYMRVLRPVRGDELRAAFADIVDGSDETAAAVSTGPPTAPDGDDSALGRYTVSFTDRARQEQIDPVAERNEELRRVADVLCRRRKNNPLLVGEAGVGKTAVVEGLARRVVKGEVREALQNVEIHALDLGALRAGARMQGEFEDRLKAVLRAVREAPSPTVLFVDEAHTLIGAGGPEGTGDAANLLKPALARGELRAIAATTWSEYTQYIEQDPALERRFQRVIVDEPSVEETTVMLRAMKGAYEEHHGVFVTERAVEATAELADRYLAGRRLPDKAVDLLDTAAARVQVSLSARPGRLDDLDRRLQALTTEIQARSRDRAAGYDAPESLDALRRRRDELRTEREALEEQWRAEKALVGQIRERRSEQDLVSRPPDEGNGAVGEDEDLEALMAELAAVQGERPLVHGAVEPELVAEVVSDWTGIPVGSMLEDEADLLLTLERRLGRHVLGQEPALHEVATTVRTSKAGLGDPTAPLGVFLFVGPSGVGKTETARRLADLIFGGERFLTTINMSEYQERHSASQLKGSPPGYVGYGEGGMLTEAVRQRPYSVVLLDEVEKAHPDVLNLFYQVFDEGVMRDGEGREVDFRNTIVVMTSNLGAATIAQEVRERDARPSLEALREAVRPTLVEHFQPALLGRMQVVPFAPLDAETMREIASLKLDAVGDRLQHAHGLSLSYDEQVAQSIADRCSRPEAGARNVDDIVRRSVLPRAAEVLIPRMADDQMPSELELRLTDQGAFTFDQP